jgi:hypothetical protein
VNLKNFVLISSLGFLLSGCNTGGASTPASTVAASVGVVTLQITPSATSIARGTTVQYRVVGLLSNGSTQDLTASATFLSSSPSLASVSSSGLATGLATGSLTITATASGLHASTGLTVTGAVLSSVSVAPTSLSLAKGTQGQLRLVGTFDDGTTQDLTSSASWTSANPSLVSVNALGLTTALGTGAVQITGAFAGMSASSAVSVSNANLVSLTVASPAQSIANGTTEQLTVTGLFSDGSTQNLTDSATYSSSNANITIAANGSVFAGAPGQTTLTASLLGLSGSTALVVTSASLSSLSLSPSSVSLAAGTSAQLRLLANFSDGSHQDLTSAALWTSSSASATVTNLGRVTGVSSGSANITASFGELQIGETVSVSAATLTSLAVSPSGQSIANGTSEQLSVLGSFSDGTTQSLTDSVTYTSTSPSDTVSSTGSVFAGAPGNATLTASLLGVTGTAQLFVSSATLTNLTLTPVSETLALGTTTQLRLRAGFSDGSTQDLTSAAMWTSSTAAATVSNLGVVTATGAGPATILASYGSEQASSSVNVTAATLVSLNVTAPGQALANGTSEQLSVTGHFSDGSSQDLTRSVSYSSSNADVAVNAAGGVQSQAPGTVTLTATLSGITGGTALTVTSATLTSAIVSPTSRSLASGTSLQLRYLAGFSDGSHQDLTSAAVWSSSAGASVTNLGVVTAQASGSVNVTGTFGGVTGMSVVTVTPAVITNVSVNPQGLSLAIGSTYQLQLRAGFSDGSVQDLTGFATWTSDEATNVSVSGAGLATAVNVGMGNVTATYGAFSSTTNVTVSSQFTPPLQLLQGCEDNLRMIGTACEEYSTDAAGRYPKSLSLLVPNYLRTIPTCPSAQADTYSQTFRSASNPDAYTFYCAGWNHSAAGIPPNYPQYDSTEGIDLPP